MESRMDRFRKFVGNHNLLRDEVLNGKKTWQNIYEDWVMFGEDNEMWNNYKKEEEKVKKTNYVDKAKNVYGVLKKVNTESLNKTLNNVQKVIQIAQSFSGPKGIKSSVASTSFTDWWD